MPAKSKEQQKLFGMVHAYQKGELKTPPSEKIKRIAQNLNYKVVKEFAETKHSDIKKSASLLQRLATIKLATASLHPLTQKAIPNIKASEGFGTELYTDKKDSDKGKYVTAPGGVRQTPEAQAITRGLGFTGEFKDKEDFKDYRDAVLENAIDARFKKLDALYGKTGIWSKLDDKTKLNLFNLHYNSGALTGWKNTAKAMAEGSLSDVLTHLKDSKTYREGAQKERWHSIINQIARDNQIEEHYNPNIRADAYYVKSVDTLGALARKHNLSLKQLLAMNPHITNPNSIGTGMPLYFTPEEKIQKAVDLPASSSTPKSLPLQQEPTPNSNNVYKIQKGDSFWKLEKNLNLKPGTLQQLNPGIDPKKLQIGQQIKTSSEKVSKMIKEVPMELELDTEKTMDSIMDKIYKENPDYFPHGLNRDLYSGNEDSLNLLSIKDSPIGFVGLQKRVSDNGDVNGYYSIGILPEYRGHGYAKQAVQHLLSLPESQKGVKEFKAYISKHNVPSLKLFDSLKNDSNSKISLETF